MTKIQIDEAKGWEVLDALTLINQADDDRDFLSGAECYAVDKAITVLREALAEQPAFVQIGNRPKEEDYTKLTSYIEALEIYVDRKELQWKAFEDYDCDAIDAMLAEKKELAQQPAQPQQGPVAWGYIDEYGEVQKFENPSSHKRDAYRNFQLLYTSPPTLSLAQRQARSADTWVGLTEEDKAEIKKQANYNWETTTGEYASKVQALTEAKLKEKNT